VNHTLKVAIVSWLDGAEPGRQPIRRSDREPAGVQVARKDRARLRITGRRAARRFLAEVA